MRTRVADDYTAIRERMEELRGGKPSGLRSYAGDIGWWRGISGYWFTPLSDKGRTAMGPLFPLKGTDCYYLRDIGPDRLSAHPFFVSCVFTEIPAPPT